MKIVKKSFISNNEEKMKHQSNLQKTFNFMYSAIYICFGNDSVELTKSTVLHCSTSSGLDFITKDFASLLILMIEVQIRNDSLYYSNKYN